LLLTGRTEHLAVFADKLANIIENVFVLKGGMGRKQRRDVASRIAHAPETEQRVILATGSYIGEGFDDARLDTLFLAANFLEGDTSAVRRAAPSITRQQAGC
jgi:hypothetical protein